MQTLRAMTLPLMVALCLLRPAAAPALTLGQVDTFEDGTTQNWIVNLLAMGGAVPAPVNVVDGGPQGAGDNYLRLTAVGGDGPGSRLSVINLAQWAGDYSAAGVTAITMDLNNLGATDLSLRLFLGNPLGGPPTDQAITDAVLLPAQGGWTQAEFALDPISLTVLAGDLATLLASVTELRLIHNPDATFPPPPVVAVLGVDNIAAPVPEPSSLTLMLLGLGFAGGAALRGRRRRAQRATAPMGL
jgi:hypothetical protein